MSMVKIRAALLKQLRTVPSIIPDAALASVSTGPSAVFTTVDAHGLITGLPVQLVGYAGGTPALDGTYYVVVTGAKTFYLQNTATKSNIAVIIPGNGGVVSACLLNEINNIYTSVIGVPYATVTFVPFKPKDPTQGGGFYQEHGLMQVTVAYPIGAGLGAILARADLIRSSFKKGSMYLSNGITVTIPDTPELGILAGTTDSIELPVKIGYMANIFG